MLLLNRPDSRLTTTMMKFTSLMLFTATLAATLVQAAPGSMAKPGKAGKATGKAAKTSKHDKADSGFSLEDISGVYSATFDGYLVPLKHSPLFLFLFQYSLYVLLRFVCVEGQRAVLCSLFV